MVACLERMRGSRALPASIVCDNGPEFTSRAKLAWAHERRIYLVFIRPGKPVENAFVEGFNGRLRDECLNEQWFTRLTDAQECIERWLRDYHARRPHSALGWRTPRNFLLRCAAPSLSPDP
ncbi:hypothetical protein rosag_42640 [Roseisolibacter agri]|uniref:Integrase catalytic domain-containing protein n=1 Tax=Roseisolibacter agri TaxID=2014610 RepID=A0AA37QDI1_9BACT|nr:hypothetical protein rosag_42640 [Roseisolibacter agri]